MGKRLMVVDDSRVVLLQMQKLLEGTEFEIAGYCRDGKKALDLYDEIRPDIVTMDIIMPGMDGLETSEALLENDPEAKIVMVSSLAYDGTIREAEGLGVKAFVYKPIEKSDFLDALEKAVSES